MALIQEVFKDIPVCKHVFEYYETEVDVDAFCGKKSNMFRNANGT